MLWYQRKDKSLVMLSKFAAFETWDVARVIGCADGAFNGTTIEQLGSAEQAAAFLNWLLMTVICMEFLSNERHYWISYEEFIEYEKGDEENGERSIAQQCAGEQR